jgi:hypothetical protein
VNWRVCFEYLPYLERSCSVIEYCKLTFNFNIHLRFCPPWTPISILRPQPLTLFLLLFHHPGRTTTSTSRLQKLKPPSSQTYSICHQPPHLSNTTYLPSIHNPYSPPLSKSPLSPLPLQTPPRHIQPLTKPHQAPAMCHTANFCYAGCGCVRGWHLVTCTTPGGCATIPHRTKGVERECKACTALRGSDGREATVEGDGAGVGGK